MKERKEKRRTASCDLTDYSALEKESSVIFCEYRNGKKRVKEGR